MRSDTDHASDDAAAHRRFLATIIVLVIAGLWIPQLGSSFRLDETATHWIVRDGVADAVHRAAGFQGESPAYFVAEWLVRVTIGSGEVAARLLSLAAMLVTAWLLIRLTTRLADFETGLVAGVVFVASQGMAFAAADARPYALALAATIAAALFVLRWTDTSSRRDALGAVVMTAAAIYLQYLSAVTLIAIYAYALWVVGERRRRLHVLAMGLAVAVLLIPAVPQVVSLSHRRDILAVPFPVSLPDLARTVVPPLLVFSVLIGALGARLRTPVTIDTRARSGRALALGSAWALTSPVVFYLVSKIGDTTLFDPRYFFVAIPGIAIIAALAVRRLTPPAVRRIVVVSVAAFAIIAFATVTHSPDEWRGAAQIVNARSSADTPILVRTAFIESRRVSWLTETEKRTYLLSPLSPYPMRGEITLVPYALDTEGRRYLESKLAGIVPSAARLLYVSLSPDDIGLWLRGRLEASGYSQTSALRAGSVSVTVFER